LRNLRSGLLDVCRIVLGDHTASVALDFAIDGVDLDRVHQVVSEVDHHAQTDKEQRDGAADSKPRIRLGPGTGANAYGKQTCRAVDEGCDESAEDNLGATVP
jgi:hypothetical protein